MKLTLFTKMNISHYKLNALLFLNMKQVNFYSTLHVVRYCDLPLVLRLFYTLNYNRKMKIGAQIFLEKCYCADCSTLANGSSFYRNLPKHVDQKCMFFIYCK